MKKMIAVAIAMAVAVFSGIAYGQCELALGFDVILLGKAIDDGYILSTFTSDVLYFDICTAPSGLTTDYFEGYLYDQFYDYWQVYGTIIWNPSFTSGYIQGANSDVTSPYIDGTIKYSRGAYSISAKGGNSDGTSFIEIYTSIKGPGGPLPATGGQAGASRKTRKDRLVDSERRRLHRVSPLPSQSPQINN
jgi:hypothetical protein